MKPETKKDGQLKLFEQRLDQLVNKNHKLIKLSERVDWKRFEDKFGELYCADNGRPGIATRLLVGLTYLKYLHDLSDREAVEVWVENPYWQYFCGEEYFQHEPPCHHANLSKWRKKIGEKGAEELLEESLAVAKDMGLLKLSYLKELYVDTTVQEKNIKYPSEANLLHRAKCKLVKLSKQRGIKLRQNYNRVAKILMIKAHRYAAAQQWNRARKAIRKLRTILGRVVRDIERKVQEADQPYFSELIELSNRVLSAHREKGKDRILSLHEPHVQAIAKGKMYKRFEFGNKVSVVITRKRGFVLGCKSLKGNPFDGHTLQEALDDMKERVGAKFFAQVGVDLGYRGHGIKEGFAVYHPKLKRLDKQERLFIRARSKVEATISMLKRCYRLGRNYLKGKLGDILNALFSGAAYNFGIALRSSG